MMAIFDGSQTFGVQARALVDLLELVDDQRRVLVRHREVDRGLDHVARLAPRHARRPGPGSFRRRSFPYVGLHVLDYSGSDSAQTIPLRSSAADLRLRRVAQAAAGSPPCAAPRAAAAARSIAAGRLRELRGQAEELQLADPVDAGRSGASCRCSTCGCASGLPSARMSPEGTSLRVERLDPVRGRASAFSFTSSSGVSALRFFFRVVALLEARVGLQLRHAEHVGHRLPLLLLVGGDVDVAVLRREACPTARR